jgi:hypothetical protein
MQKKSTKQSKWRNMERPKEEDVEGKKVRKIKRSRRKEKDLK